MQDMVAPASVGHLKVARLDQAVLIQVVGIGNLFLAPTLQAFVESEIKNEFANFVVDLQQCQGMDSTFMGTFIGLAGLAKNRYGWFCLVNVSSDNFRLLKMLGVLHVVPIRDSFPVKDAAATDLFPTNDPYARQRQIHGAHRFLMEVDPKNRERFGPFIQALEEELGSGPKILPPEPPPGDRGSAP